MQRNAARYQWLRDHSQPGICTFYLSVGNGLHGVKFNRATVDEAIDAQIAALRGSASETAEGSNFPAGLQVVIDATVHLEQMRPGFDKLHLNRDSQMPGWTWHPVIHRFTTPEAQFHDHPFDFTSTVLRGSYIEAVYVGERILTRQRSVGDRFEVKAETRHRIVALPDGECFTFVEYGPRRR